MSDPKIPKAWTDAYREATRPDPDRRACPGADALAGLAVDPGAADPALLDHVADCRACSDELQRVTDDGTLAALTEALADDPPPSAASPTRGGRTRTLLGGWALAASLVVAVGVTLLVPTRDDAPTLRSGPAVEGLVPPSGARLEAVPERFEWPAGGRDEQLVLMTPRADILWIAPVVRDGRVAVPDAVRDELVDGRYYWQVRDLDRDALLGPFEFRLDRS
ncbi:hypothetical protein HFP89_00435 [Wenzhouxiangella sp. XN79A]|uniref:hypothetical protein n=1 Tax=Wenzhouxiangella sp. XN79A TaxID=2724193 RepID=UPI00144AE59C|nr:hypothetical protein [Wenzhouxiangella sp. XN79A]NKI33630.1 hypothetical protein [Wenzhouxiangella sp. XN79A]